MEHLRAGRGFHRRSLRWRRDRSLPERYLRLLCRRLPHLHRRDQHQLRSHRRRRPPPTRRYPHRLGWRVMKTKREEGASSRRGFPCGEASREPPAARAAKRGRPPMVEGTARTCVFPLKMSRNELRSITLHVEAKSGSSPSSGLSVSQWARQAILDTLAREALLLASPQGKPRCPPQVRLEALSVSSGRK